MPVIAQDPLGRKAINGSIDSCQIQVFRDGRLVRAQDFDLRLKPAQPNNMSEWFRATVLQIGFRQIVDWMRHHGKNWDLEARILVNDGQGPKVGRGRGENKFSYHFDIGDESWHVDLHIRSVGHQQRYAQMKRQNPDYKPDPNHWAAKKPGIGTGEEYINDDGQKMIRDQETGIWYPEGTTPPRL